MAKTKRKDAPITVGAKSKPTVVDAQAAAGTKQIGPKKPKDVAKAVKLVVSNVHSKSTPAPKRNVAPSQEIATQLQDAFDFFNTSLFHNKLLPCVLTLERLRRYVGYFRPKQWTIDRKAGALDGSTHQITLDPDRLRNKGDKVVLSTLVHEMAHQIIWDATFAETGKFKRPYHCSDWVAVMQTVGLEPVIVSKDGKRSDKKTGANATHEIVKGGDFDKAADTLIAKGFKLEWLLVPVPEKAEGKKKKAGVKVKYTCGGCDTSFWGKGGIRAECQPCGEPFIGEGSEDGGDE